MASEWSRVGCDVFCTIRHGEVVNVLLSESPLLCRLYVIFLLVVFSELHLVFLFVPYPRCCPVIKAHCATGRSKALFT
jgi:hypothetical protein